MFNKKEKTLEVVKCEDCKFLISKKDAQVVYIYTDFLNDEIYYCLGHRKPYDSVNKKPDRNNYFGKVQMSEDGTPIGYEKIKKAK